MRLVKLTPENASKYVGYNILFRTRGSIALKQIVGTSESGKTVKIVHGNLQNALEIVHRNVYVIVEEVGKPKERMFTRKVRRSE